MKKYSFTLLASIALFFFYSCKSQKNTASQNLPTDSDSLIISIQKFPCFGKCAYYNAKIFAGGYVWYEGKANTDKTGVYETRVTNSQINEILEEAKRINYSVLPDSFYNAGIADYPVTITSIKQKGNLKTVFHGAPEGTDELQKFEVYLHNFFHAPELKWRLIRKPGGDE